MAKKRNFLGGMQNYNPDNGQYESRLTKADGTPATKDNMPGGEQKTFSKFTKTKKPTDYEGVKETQHDFIYDVGGVSITDVAGERKSMGRKIDETKKYGFSVSKDGEEYIYDTFEEAYNSVKNPKTESDEPADDWVDTMDEFEDKLTDLMGEHSVSGLTNEEFNREIDNLQKQIENYKDKLPEDEYQKVVEKLNKAKIPSSNDKIDDKVLSMIREGKSDTEIKKWLEQNDESGEFDWYDADGYLEYMRGKDTETDIDYDKYVDEYMKIGYPQHSAKRLSYDRALEEFKKTDKGKRLQKILKDRVKAGYDSEELDLDYVLDGYLGFGSLEALENAMKK